MKRWLTLQIIIPGIIFIFAITGIASAFVINRQYAINYTTKHTINTIKARLNFIQGSVLQFLKTGNIDGINQLVASLYSENDLISFIITSESGEIIISNRYAQLGLHWNQLAEQINLQYVSESIKQNATNIYLSDDSRLLDGYSSLCQKQVLGKIHNDTCGFIFYRINMQYHYDNEINAITKQSIYTGIGIASGVFVLWLIIQIIITRRINNLIAGIDTFTLHDRSTRITFSGHDELSKLTSSINSMFSIIEFDQKELLNREYRLDSLFQTAIDAIIVINEKGTIQQANPATEKLFGYTLDEMVNRNVKLLVPEPHHSNHDQYLKNYLETGVRKIIGIGRDTDARRKDGSTFPIELAISEMEINGERMFTGIVRDISERKRLEQELRQSHNQLLSINQQLEISSQTDKLTGLSNRGHFDRIIAEELNRCTRQKTPLTLFMCDIDYFKQYNDAYGHLAGDLCLQQVAKTMIDVFQRDGELACRYGGEEFAVILPQVDNAGAEHLANKLITSIQSLQIPHQGSKVAEHVTLSIGYTIYTPTTTNPPNVATLIQHADKALYQAKASGRNQTCRGKASTN